MTTIATSDTVLRTDEFAEKIFDAVRGAALVQAIYLGDRLGWYRALADEGPLTAAELAHRTGTVERYAREWLEQQSVSGNVVAHLSQEAVRFELPREYADVLADTRQRQLYGADGPVLHRDRRCGCANSWRRTATAAVSPGSSSAPTRARRRAPSTVPCS